jgi:hypothetical protein
MSMSVGSGEDEVPWQKQETASSMNDDDLVTTKNLKRVPSSQHLYKPDWHRSGGQVGIALNKHKY